MKAIIIAADAVDPKLIKKYRSELPTINGLIDDGAFIGSNTCLVAPVTVGAGAIIGAGSTITAEVPPGALGIARGKQKNITGWTTRKRQENNEKTNKNSDL